MAELFDLAEVGERKPLPKGGYPARPGSGPPGETCGTCRHYCRVKWHDKTYRKCGAAKESWTHGTGSDILARAAACVHWEKRT